MIIILSANVLSTFSPVPRITSHHTAVWQVVVGVSAFLIAAVVVFRLRGRRCKRNIPYEPQIDVQASSKHSRATYPQHVA